MSAIMLGAAIGGFAVAAAGDVEPPLVCWTAAKRVVTTMFELAAENDLTIIAPVSNTELEALLRKNAGDLEARGACEIIAMLPDSLLREMVRASLKAKES